MKRKRSQKQVNKYRVQTLLACYGDKKGAMDFIGQLMAAFVGKKLIPPMVPQTAVHSDCMPLTDYRKTLTEQALTHFRESGVLGRELQDARDALRAAVILIDHFCRNECLHCRKIYAMMTPADRQRVEEIRKLVMP